MATSQPSARQPRAPLHLCAITLSSHASPVAAPDGTVFDASTILQLVRRTGLNPITGAPLAPHHLVPLSLSRDPRSRLPRCPILFHPFSLDIKIVAIATSGNVYSYAAVHRFNLQPAHMLDLLDRTPFTLQDIIVLYDPQLHIWSTHPSAQPPTSRSSPPVRPRNPLCPVPPISARDPPDYSLNAAHVTTVIPDSSTRDPPSIQKSATRQLTHLNPLSSSSPSQSSRLPVPPSVLSSTLAAQPLTLPTPAKRPISPESTEHPQPMQPPTLIHPSNPASSNTMSGRAHVSASLLPSAYPPTPSMHNMVSSHVHRDTRPCSPASAQLSPIPKKPRLHLSAHKSSRGPSAPALAPSHPSYSPDDHTSSTKAFFDRKKAEEQRKAVYKRVRKGRKGKGYVRVVTNIGHLNIELHCDKVPVACDNFLSLAETKYYNGLRWHRVVPGFIAQTGDPTGTGDGGDSFWGGCLKDEIRTSLAHDSSGVVSMANSGRDTNRSQWFICLDTAPHLDGSHTVFGKVVGGLFVLKKMESEAEMGHPLTVETIEVLVNPIRQIREQMQAAAEIAPPMPIADTAGTPISSQQSSRMTHMPLASDTERRKKQKHAVDQIIPRKATIQHVIHPKVEEKYGTGSESHRQDRAMLPPARTLLTAANIAPSSGFSAFR